MEGMRGLLVASTVAALAAGCTRARTELVVGLITNLSATDQVDTVTLTGDVGGQRVIDRRWAISGLPDMPEELPGSFGIYTSDGSQPSVTLIATGLSGGNAVVKRRAILSLVGEKTLFLRMGLVDVCQHDGCGPDETCIEGACRPAAIDSRRLPVYLRGMESGVTCPANGILYKNTSTKKPVPIAGDGSCAGDEECVEGTCIKTALPGEDLAGVAPPADLSVPPDLAMPDLSMPPDLWTPGLGCATPEVFTLSGNGSAAFFDGTGGAGGTASFHDPIAIAIGPNGTVFVSDTTNRRIRAVAPDGSTTTLAGNGTSGQNDGSGGPLGTASFLSPRGLAFDGSHTLYVADGDLIRTVDTTNGATTHFAGAAGALYAEGTGASATFKGPVGLTWDASCGCLYVADTGNHLIRTLTTPGAVSARLAGTPNSAGYTDGAALSAKFSGPNGVASNATSVYVTDLNNHRVRLITLDLTDGGAGAMVSTFSGSGTPGYTEGAAAIAQFNFPGGLALGAGGVVYVADSGNDRIRAIAPDGSTSLLAGAGTPGFSDGTAPSAGFYDPAALAFDGGLYVADQLNQRIRRVVCP